MGDVDLRDKRTAIWRERLRIYDERRKEMHDRMSEYDNTVFRPAMKALVEECAALGHTRGKEWDNGLGAFGYYCGQCAYRIVESRDDG